MLPAQGTVLNAKWTLPTFESLPSAGLRVSVTIAGLGLAAPPGEPRSSTE
jgi:hypothetical protein